MKWAHLIFEEAQSRTDILVLTHLDSQPASQQVVSLRLRQKKRKLFTLVMIGGVVLIKDSDDLCIYAASVL